MPVAVSIPPPLCRHSLGTVSEVCCTYSDCIPARCFFQRSEVCSEILACRVISANGIPNSICMSTATIGSIEIWSVEGLLRFTTDCLIPAPWRRLPNDLLSKVPGSANVCQCGGRYALMTLQAALAVMHAARTRGPVTVSGAPAVPPRSHIEHDRSDDVGARATGRGRAARDVCPSGRGFECAEQRVALPASRARRARIHARPGSDRALPWRAAMQWPCSRLPATRCSTRERRCTCSREILSPPRPTSPCSCICLLGVSVRRGVNVVRALRSRHSGPCEATQ